MEVQVKEILKKVSRDFFRSPGFYGGLSGVALGGILSGDFDPMRMIGPAILLSALLFSLNCLALWIAIRIKERHSRNKNTENAPD